MVVLSPQELESKIRGIISDISAGIGSNKMDPQKIQKSGIGKLFSQLRDADPALCLVLTQEYKPVCVQYNESLKRKLKEISSKFESDLSDDEESFMKSHTEKEKKEAEKEKRKAKEIDAAMNGVLRGGTSGGIDRSERAKKVKKEKAPRAPKVPNPTGERDTTVFVFEGKTYGKGPFVLAMARRIAADNPNMGVEDLRKKLPDSFMRSYGVIQRVDQAREKRFFLKKEQLITCKDGVIAVCSQWGKDNIIPLVDHIISLGYEIEKTQKS